MSDPLYIRIEKCLTDAWYASRIGETLPVEWSEINRRADQGLPGDVYWVRTGDLYNTLHWVLQSDATIVDVIVAIDDSDLKGAPGDTGLPAPCKSSILDRTADEWDTIHRARARTVNPHGDRLDEIDRLIAEEQEIQETGLLLSRDAIWKLRKERATLLNDEEKACNLFAMMADHETHEKEAKSMTIQQLGDRAYEVLHAETAEAEAIFSEMLERMGWRYVEEDEIPTLPTNSDQS